ncbi:MAG: VOC family protein [Pseudomonadota bacterium]
MQPDGILETAVYADDLEAASTFYGAILGMPEVLRVPGRHVFFSCGSGMLLVFNPAATQTAGGDLPVPTHGATGQGHICFRVEADVLDAWIEKLTSKRVEIEADFRWPNGARSIYVRDPAGNSVEFAEPKLWGLPA